MLNPRRRGARAVVGVVAGVASLTGLTACGSSSGGSGAPTNASKASFCATFDKLSSHDAPHDVAASLRRVGTPGNISSQARRGFEVLLDRLGKLPAHANKGDISQMARGLTGNDQSDVIAFVTYYTTECQGLPGDGSS